MNNKAEKKELLRTIQAVGLIAVDLHLYLDTHANDVRALADYKDVCEQYAKLKKAYEKAYGPLTSSSVLDSNRFNWVDDPWPWHRQ